MYLRNTNIVHTALTSEHAFQKDETIAHPNKVSNINGYLKINEGHDFKFASEFWGGEHTIQ